MAVPRGTDFQPVYSSSCALHAGFRPAGALLLVLSQPKNATLQIGLLAVALCKFYSIFGCS
jgi:hypothetical protein